MFLRISSELPQIFEADFDKINNNACKDQRGDALY